MGAVPRRFAASLAAAGCWLTASMVLHADPAKIEPAPVAESSPSNVGTIEQSESTVSIDEAPECDPIWRLMPQDGLFRATGWLDAGFIGNTGSPQSKFNGPYNAVDRSNEPMFNQAYLILERGLPTDGGFGVGTRVDMLYGEDFLLAQSLGLETRPNGQSHWNDQYYGLALPQSYVSVGNDALSVKAGHFYSIVGYEGVMSPTNFFYSKAYSYQFAGPFTHWGGIGSWKASSNIEIQAGVQLGWNALDSTVDRPGFIGGIKYTADSKLWWTSFAVVTGDELTNAANLPGIANGIDNRTRYSLILDLTPTDRIEYLIHQWLGAQADGNTSGGSALWYGVDQYLYYRLADTVKVGGRVEWFRDDDGTRIGLNRPSNPNKPPFPGSAYSCSLGVNWTPVPNLILRPEIRSDWFVGNVAREPYDDGRKSQQFMLGFDAILKF